MTSGARVWAEDGCPTPKTETKTVQVPLRDMTAALSDVIAERRRQIEVEGWTPEHDDEHAAGELARAAATYAAHTAFGDSASRQFYGCLWPFGDGFKPTTPRRDLVKATALMLAEIERLDRVGAANTKPSSLGDKA